jgi:MoaA/NifB/PqqE/SkfB family radical SAM enzyme
MQIKKSLRKIIYSNPLANSLYKKYRIYRYDKVELQSVVIYANSFCNAECSFCDVPKVSEEDGTASGIARPLLGAPLYMSTELFEQIISDRLVNSGKPKFINFLMTEPLLSKNLAEMLRIAKNNGHTTKVTTNGYLLSKRAEEIASYVDYLQISIDALQPLHDKIRGKGFFERAINGLKEIKKISDIRIEINITMAPINYRESYELLIHLDTLGIVIDEVRFQLLDFVSESMSNEHNLMHSIVPQSPTDSDEGLSFADINPVEMLSILNKIRKFKAKNINGIYIKPNLTKLSDIVKYFDVSGDVLPGHDVCAAPFNQLAVSTSGDVYWHMRCYNDYKLGNINKSSLYNIFHGFNAEAFRNEFRKSDCCMTACTRCCGLMNSEQVF